MYYDLIIIGNSAAGLSAIKTIRVIEKISIAIFDKEYKTTQTLVLVF